ncbi:hypothetical protein DPMN_164484 [Dreissena polymorpha]|uniref:Uncharacterized protein n=1 Tax=Dreissena polymorpha TaxID=45954 RepID=A0A9D4EYT4_DREPO|nr:hypothetical protein DPMN_164484 [Dreissena polymorpha]
MKPITDTILSEKPHTFGIYSTAKAEQTFFSIRGGKAKPVDAASVVEAASPMVTECQATLVQAQIGLLDANLAMHRLAQKETEAAQMVDQCLAGSRAEASVRPV